MSVGAGPTVQEYAVARVRDEEGVRCRAGGVGVGVVDEDDAVVGEVRRRDLETEALVLVAVIAIVEVDADGRAMLPLEVGAIVHVVKGVRGAAVLLEASPEV